MTATYEFRKNDSVVRIEQGAFENSLPPKGSVSLSKDDAIHPEGIKQ